MNTMNKIDLFNSFFLVFLASFSIISCRGGDNELPNPVEDKTLRLTKLKYEYQEGGYNRDTLVQFFQGSRLGYVIDEDTVILENGKIIHKREYECTELFSRHESLSGDTLYSIRRDVANWACIRNGSLPFMEIQEEFTNSGSWRYFCSKFFFDSFSNPVIELRQETTYSHYLADTIIREFDSFPNPFLLLDDRLWAMAAKGPPGFQVLFAFGPHNLTYEDNPTYWAWPIPGSILTGSHIYGVHGFPIESKYVRKDYQGRTIQKFTVFFEYSQ